MTSFSAEDWEQLSQLAGLLVVVDIHPRWAGVFPYEKNIYVYLWNNIFIYMLPRRFDFTTFKSMNIVIKFILCYAYYL